MSSETPFFCMTVSSSLATSSNVNPYWRPEQPPPVTNTRSLSSLLPSSSISDFTLLAALSVKTSGSGIAVAMSFMRFLRLPSVRAARCGLELDDLVALLGRFVHQLPHHDRADVDLDGLVRHIPCDSRLGEEFDVLGRPHGAGDGAIDDHMGYIDLALDFCKLRDDQGARLVSRGTHIALHVAVDPKASREGDVSLDRRAAADQAVDRARLVGLSEHV